MNATRKCENRQTSENALLKDLLNVFAVFTFLKDLSWFVLQWRTFGTNQFTYLTINLKCFVENGKKLNLDNEVYLTVQFLTFDSSYLLDTKSLSKLYFPF